MLGAQNGWVVEGATRRGRKGDWARQEFRDYMGL